MPAARKKKTPQLPIIHIGVEIHKYLKVMSAHEGITVQDIADQFLSKCISERENAKQNNRPRR